MAFDALAEPDESFDRLARVLRDSIDSPVAQITIVEPDRQIFPGSVGIGEPWNTLRATPISHSFCQYVVKDAAPLVIADARLDERLHDNPAITELGVIAYAGVPLRDDEDKVIGSVCAIDHKPREWSETDLRILHDIGHVASAEIRLRASATSLSRSYEQLTMFAGQISHDLKSPLGAILGFLDLIREELVAMPDATPRATGYVDRCTSSGHRMVRTIDELLAYSTVGGTLKLREISLDEVMRAVVQDLRPDVGNSDVSWTDGTIYADTVQLRCLLQNLVGNAIKFKHRDRPSIVTVSVGDFPTHAELRVVDNGSGIPLERRDEVLRPMVRLRRDIPGSGLGLATCDRIATAHGGLVQISGTPGGGTTIAVQFPKQLATAVAS